MNAAVLVEQKKPLKIIRIQLPEALGYGQVLVKLTHSGICGSQLGEIDGVKGPDRFLPHLLGHEGAGTVVSTGDGVSQVGSGDAVVLHWRKGKGIEAAPAKYLSENGEVVNAGWVTTFNEYAVVSENRVTRVPASSDMEINALLGCAVTTGFGVIQNNAKVKIGESVTIFGSGGVGLNMVQAAAMVSAWPIIAVDRYDNRLELAKRFGATHTINSTREDAVAGIQEIIGGSGLDVFIDNTGIPSIIESGYQLTHGNGRVVLVGVPKKDENICIHSLPLHFGKRIEGSHGGESDPSLDIPRYESMCAAGRMKFKDLITNRYSLFEINEAIMDMRTGRASGRCLINF